MVYLAAKNRSEKHKRNDSAFLILKPCLAVSTHGRFLFLNACVYTLKSASLAF